jgi:hypothetical protein
MNPSVDSQTMEYYIFLNRLRESGATNMFGATPYLQNTFDLDRKTASNVLTSWMHWVNDNPDNRNL